MGFGSQILIVTPPKDGTMVRFLKMKILRVKVGKKYIFINFQEGVTFCDNIGFSSYGGIW